MSVKKHTEVESASDTKCLFRASEHVKKKYQARVEDE